MANSYEKLTFGLEKTLGKVFNNDICVSVGVGTSRTQDNSDPRHFGTSAEVSVTSSAPLPNCPDTSALVEGCSCVVRSTLILHGVRMLRECIKMSVHTSST